MFQYHSVQTHIDLHNGKRRNKTQRVSIKGSKGFKQVTILGPGTKRHGNRSMRRTSKKALTKKEIQCIRKCQFIPGLFRKCEECLL